MCVVCDLLELISSLVLALRPHRVVNGNGYLCAGVWSPELKRKSPDPEKDVSRRIESKPSPSAAEQLPPVWTPNSSPTPDRKTYKPIRFESPTLPRKKTAVDTKKVCIYPIQSDRPVNNGFVTINARESSQVSPKPATDLAALTSPSPPPPPPPPIPPVTFKTQGKRARFSIVSHVGT